MKQQPLVRHQIQKLHNKKLLIQTYIECKRNVSMMAKELGLPYDLLLLRINEYERTRRKRIKIK